jgi:hypothetical protein
MTNYPVRINGEPIDGVVSTTIDFGPPTSFCPAADADRVLRSAHKAVGSSLALSRSTARPGWLLSDLTYATHQYAVTVMRITGELYTHPSRITQELIDSDVGEYVPLPPDEPPP